MSRQAAELRARPAGGRRPEDPADQPRPGAPRGRALDALLLLCLTLITGATIGCEPGTAAEAQAEPPVSVRVQPIARGTISRTLSRMGEVHAEVEVRVFGQIPDRILDLRVDAGDRVTKGQVLAIISSDALAAGVAQAAATLESARVQRDKLKADLRRAETLLAAHVISAVQVESLGTAVEGAQAQVRSLEAVVAQAASRRQQAVVRAPMDGLVGIRHLARGDLAMPQIPIVTLVEDERVKVVLQATEQELPHLAVTTAVEVRVAAYPDEVFRGQVSRVAPVIHPLTRHAEVEILLPNEDRRLRPGMLAQVMVVLERREGALLVPLYSLVLEPGQDAEGRSRYHGFVVEGGVARRRQLQVGLMEGGHAEVVAGLREGETLVVRGQHLLSEGGSVEVTQTSESVKQAAAAEAAPGAAAGGPDAPGATPDPKASDNTAARPPVPVREGQRGEVAP